MTQNINLCDPSLRARRDLLGFESALAIVAAALFCVALAAAGARWSLARLEPVATSSASELVAKQAAVQALAAQAAGSKPDTTLQAEIAGLQRTLTQRGAALRVVNEGAVDREGGFAGRLEALARQSIEGLWLTGVVLRQDDVLLKGRTLTPSLIPVFVQRLDQEPSLQGRSFKALDVVRPLESPAAAASLPATSATSSAAAVGHAGFVEFTLVGADAVVPLASGGKP